MSDPFLIRPRRLVLVDVIDRAVNSVESRAIRSIDRRLFLGTIARWSGSSLAAAYATSLLAACGSHGPEEAQSLLRAAQRRNESVEAWLFRHTGMNHARAGAADAGARFPSYYVAPAVPTWDEAALGTWSLAVTGAVATPLRLTLAELRGLPVTGQRVDHFCVEGWTAIATWTGVQVSRLAALAGAAPSAKFVDFKSFDVDRPGHPGYHECWDVASAMHPQTIVAYGMDGELLGPAHGAPARVHSPVKLGYKNTKYLTEIVFRMDRTGGYWSDQGYEWYGGT